MKSYDFKAAARWHFVFHLTKAKTFVASRLEREVTGGISAAKANHTKVRVGLALLLHWLLKKLRLATLNRSHTQLKLHKMSALTLLMHKPIISKCHSVI